MEFTLVQKAYSQFGPDNHLQIGKLHSKYGKGSSGVAVYPKLAEASPVPSEKEMAASEPL